MASKTIVQRSDDLDPEVIDGVEEVKFGLFGQNYLIDLAPKNQQALEDSLQEFLAVARKTSTRTGKPVTSKVASDYNAREVRAWAAEAGITVPPRGRIPGAVIEQYRANA